ncbi:MAG TPA: hypothetical protein VF756_06430, partial [Thermoanaerobaculia bacterium]
MQEDRFARLDTSKVRQLAKFKIDYSRVRILEEIDKEQKKPEPFSDFVLRLPRSAFQTEQMPRPAFPPDEAYLQNFSAIQYPKGKMIVVVAWDLYPQVQASVDQYVIDVANDGYFATVFKVKGGKPQDFRAFLQGKMPIVGALLVGNVMPAWFEMDDDFFGAHAEFPCDLYYMDLNGTWSDPDGDGKFSGHAANVDPEIWIGRLWTPTLNGSDPALINDYFGRNHLYRKGLLGYSRSALAYVDDDWTGFGDCGFDLMFPVPNLEVITDPATTDGDRYKSEINQSRGWSQVCAHSSPFGHSFSTPGGGEWVPGTYLRDTAPPNAFFYNLFACSTARYTEPDCMGGWYIFDKASGSKNFGLVAVGSTKTGSMLYFENFYGPMGSGKVVGDAYKDWWKALGPNHELGERQWFYGMTLLGDPTLNWWTGVVPILRDPGNGDTFDHFPRKTHYRWDPITLPGVTYTIEIDAFGAVAAGKWAAEVGATFSVTSGLVNP